MPRLVARLASYGVVAATLVIAGCQRASDAPATPAYPHADEPIGALREIYDGTLTPAQAIRTFRNIDRLLPTRMVRPGPVGRALPMASPSRQAALQGLTVAAADARYTLDAMLDSNRVAALLVLVNDSVALERYRYGNTPATRWMSMSVAKSITSTLVGAALRQGFIGSLDDQVITYVPALRGSAYDGVSVRDVLMMSSGVRWRETYTDSSSDRRHLLEAQLSLTPGSAMQLMRTLPRASAPGTRNTYNTGETQVVAEVVRQAVGQPLAAYLSERIWSRYAMESPATWWLESPDGIEIGGSGFSATLRDYARFGQFVLGDGVAGGDSILPAGWMAEATTPRRLRDGTPLDSGYLWWTGTTDTQRRDRAFAAEGIHGQFLYVNPALHLVIVLWSARPQPSGGAVVDEWAFFDAVSAALR